MLRSEKMSVQPLFHGNAALLKGFARFRRRRGYNDSACYDIGVHIIADRQTEFLTDLLERFGFDLPKAVLLEKRGRCLVDSTVDGLLIEVHVYPLLEDGKRKWGPRSLYIRKTLATPSHILTQK